MPYSPLLLTFGLALGYFGNKLGDFSYSLSIIQDINPHLIYYVFIPAIIFESSFNIDPFVFKKRLLQIFILAITGVGINTLISGIGFRIFLNYSNEISWAAAFTFSSIVSATDPVAVVALLKEMGTSKQFNVLLEGESLLNDGTAAVFYIVCS